MNGIITGKVEKSSDYFNVKATLDINSPMGGNLTQPFFPEAYQYSTNTSTFYRITGYNAFHGQQLLYIFPTYISFIGNDNDYSQTERANPVFIVYQNANRVTMRLMYYRNIGGRACLSFRFSTEGSSDYISITDCLTSVEIGTFD